jgi:hypothetical protein
MLMALISPLAARAVLQHYWRRFDIEVDPKVPLEPGI